MNSRRLDEEPLGQRESSTVEFKSAELLRTDDGRRKLLRAITALRNGSVSGILWIGVKESGGMATAFDELREDERPLLERLRDTALDTLEPEPKFTIDPPVRTDADLVLHWIRRDRGFIVRVEVRPIGVDGPPACLRIGNAREFLRRADARTTLIPFEELVRSKSRSATDPSFAASTQARNRHDLWRKQLKDVAGLALTIDLHPECEALDEAPQAWVDLLKQPPSELTRKNGWTWFIDHHRPTRRQGRIETGVVKDGRVYRKLQVEPVGSLRFFTDLPSLMWPPLASPLVDRLIPDHRGQLGAVCIVETIVSTVRLALRLFQALPTPPHGSRFTTCASLSGARGHVIPLFAPGSYGALMLSREDCVHVPADLIVTHPQIRLFDDLHNLKDADHLSRSLLRRLFECDDQLKELGPRDIPWLDESGTFAPTS